MEAVCAMTAVKKWRRGAWTWRRGRILAVAVAVLLLPRALAAEQLLNTPVYNPETRSYFEFHVDQPLKDGKLVGYDRENSIEWYIANRRARNLVHKGVRGHLAIVKSQSVNDFLRETFKPEIPAWIGLRYWCAYNALQWVSGETHKTSAYKNWDAPWRYSALNRGEGDRAPPSCPTHIRGNYLPVHYWPVSQGFVWHANGMGKEFRGYFVEYPTGKP